MIQRFFAVVVVVALFRCAISPPQTTQELRNKPSATPLMSRFALQA